VRSLHCGNPVARLRSRLTGVTSEPEVAEARMISRSRTAAVPVKFAVAFSDRKVVDAGVTLLHQPHRVVEPILVAVGTEPVAAVVMPLVSEADGDTVSGECPEFLDQAVTSSRTHLRCRKAMIAGRPTTNSLRLRQRLLGA